MLVLITSHSVYKAYLQLFVITCTLVLSVLQGLTQVEEMLISAVKPIMSIYQLPHGQYGYSGHVINLPQDISFFANCLPRLPSDIDVIVVREKGANQSNRDLRVRRSVVHQALIAHNKQTMCTSMSASLISYQMLS